MKSQVTGEKHFVVGGWSCDCFSGNKVDGRWMKVPLRRDYWINVVVGAVGNLSSSIATSLVAGRW